MTEACSFKGDIKCMQRAVLRVDLKQYLCNHHYNLEVWRVNLGDYQKADLEFMIKAVFHELKTMNKRERRTIYRFCDKCNRTYPNDTDKCNYCAGGLREFEVPFDLSFFESLE